MLSTSLAIRFVATSDPKTARELYKKNLGLTFIGGDQFALVFDIGECMLRIQKVDKATLMNTLR
jgi:hypothetical protein